MIQLNFHRMTSNLEILKVTAQRNDVAFVFAGVVLYGELQYDAVGGNRIQNIEPFHGNRDQSVVGAVGIIETPRQLGGSTFERKNIAELRMIVDGVAGNG